MSGASENDHQLAVRLAVEAGKVLVDLRARLFAQRLPIWQVRDEGDYTAHHFIVDELAEARPDDAVLSEEGRDHPNRVHADRCWVIDPLDGTNEFGIEGRSDWAVHIALVIDGWPVVGAVSLPAMGLVFGTDPAPPHPPKRDRKVRMVTSRSRTPYAALVIAEALGADMARLGSAGAKTMAVVAGEADIYAHAGGQYEWDSAAPAAVAKAAGFHVSRLDGSPLVYNQPDPWLPDLLVCRPELAEPILDALWR
ncbi:MAG: 3'(2'),5'-bisphosphate nucleotidase CysQ [Acidimicrobiia bacterium]